MRATRPVAAVAAGLLAVGLAACGDDAGPAPTETTQATQATQSTETTETARTTEAGTVTDTPPEDPTGFTGTWVDPHGKGYLTFDGEGGVTGSDACNGITTTYSVEGTGATVEPFPTTMMACGEGWSQWLLGVSTVELRDGTLAVLGQDGEELGVLVPGDAP
ncbi:META domain-containing protein [Corynebacteriaceae bacterium 7-707]